MFTDYGQCIYPLLPGKLQGLQTNHDKDYAMGCVHIYTYRTMVSSKYLSFVALELANHF